MRKFLQTCSDVDKRLAEEFKSYNFTDKKVHDLFSARYEILDELEYSVKKRNFNYEQWRRDLITITDHLYDALVEKYLSLRSIVHKNNALLNLKNGQDTDTSRYLLETELTINHTDDILKWSLRNCEQHSLK